MKTAGLIAMMLTLSTGAWADKAEWNSFIDHDQKPIAVAPATPIKAEPAPKAAPAAKSKAVAAKPKAAPKPAPKASAKRKGR
jgi:hypothetical protein